MVNNLGEFAVVIDAELLSIQILLLLAVSL